MEHSCKKFSFEKILPFLTINLWYCVKTKYQYRCQYMRLCVFSFKNILTCKQNIVNIKKKSHSKNPIFQSNFLLKFKPVCFVMTDSIKCWQEKFPKHLESRRILCFIFKTKFWSLALFALNLAKDNLKLAATLKQKSLCLFFFSLLSMFLLSSSLKSWTDYHLWESSLIFFFLKIELLFFSRPIFISTLISN